MADEPPPGDYREALMSAAGKRERIHAYTGMTPPAKAASPIHYTTQATAMTKKRIQKPSG